ncbi:MAG: STAS domain-containing protein [Candidatus Dormibacteria bacterium]
MPSVRVGPGGRDAGGSPGPDSNDLERALVPAPDEIDAANADSFGASLEAATATGSRIILADLTRTTFCGAAGVRALVEARDRVQAAGAEFRLAVTSHAVLRILDLLGLRASFEIVPGVGEEWPPTPLAPSPGGWRLRLAPAPG